MLFAGIGQLLPAGPAGQLPCLRAPKDSKEEGGERGVCVVERGMLSCWCW